MRYLTIYDHTNLKCDDMNFTRDQVSFTCCYKKSTCEHSGFCVDVFIRMNYSNHDNQNWSLFGMTRVCKCLLTNFYSLDLRIVG